MSNGDDRTEPFSLAELRFYLTRAGVGTGVPFGVAEDFAGAIVTIARMGFGVSALAGHALSDHDTGSSCAAMTVKREGSHVHFKARNGGALSALYAGCAVVDHLSMIDDAVITVHAVDHPLLVAGYLSAPALKNVQAQIGWPSSGSEAVTMTFESGRPVTIHAENESHLLPRGPVDVTARRESAITEPASPVLATSHDLQENHARALNEGVCLDAESWKHIYAMFTQYLVPSSAAARATGAGAGLIDRD